MPRSANVATPTSTYETMRTYFTVVRDLLGGTKTLREKGKDYLPQHAAETQSAYETRLGMAVLTPFFENLVWFFVGKVFARPVEVLNGPETMQAWIDDIDLNGRHLRVFARDLFAESYAMGLGYIYVDSPREIGETLAEAWERNARPYFVHVPTENVIEVRTDDFGRLIRVRIVEEVSTWDNPENEFDETVVERVRVITPEMIRIFEKVEAGNYTEVDSMTNPFGFIPLVPVFTGQRKDYGTKPPMSEIAYLNIAHYQFRSNHQNALTVAQFPMLAASGVKNEEKKSVTIGPRKLLRADDPDARFYYVEHTGAALASGRNYIDDLAIEMVSHGIQLMRPKGSEHNATTATEERIREQTSLSSIQTVAYNLSNALEVALKMMAQVGGINEAEYTDLQVLINSSYTLSVSDVQEISVLAEMNLTNRLTLPSLFTELKRRGVLSDAFNVDAEIKALEEQGLIIPTEDPTAIDPDSEDSAQGIENIRQTDESVDPTVQDSSDPNKNQDKKANDELGEKK